MCFVSARSTYTSSQAIDFRPTEYKEMVAEGLQYPVPGKLDVISAEFDAYAASSTFASNRALATYAVVLGFVMLETHYNIKRAGRPFA